MLRCSASLVTLGVLSAGLLFSVGCAEEDPLPAVEVRGRISTDLDTVLREASLAEVLTRHLLPSQDALAMTAQVLGSQTPLAIAAKALAATLAIEPPRLDVQATIAYLNDQLFDDASYDGGGIYRVSASRLCPDDAACAAQLAPLDLRIRTAIVENPDARFSAPGSPSAAPALEVALQIGATHDEAVTITLAHERLVITADLDLLQPALGALAAVAGATSPGVALSGQLRAQVRTDPTGASLIVWIDRPIAIRVAGASGDPTAADALVLTSAAGQVLSTSLSQTADLGYLLLTVGPTTVERTYRGRRLVLDLAGLYATSAFNAYTPLLINDIGFGDRAAILTADGRRAATIDINPDDGRDFNVIVQRDDGIDNLQVVPKLDLHFAVDHAVLGDDAPAFDVTQISFDGTLLRRAADRLELTAGSFAIATDPASHGFTAAAGPCITFSDAPILAWAIAPCR